MKRVMGRYSVMLVVLADVAAITLAWWLAFNLRFDFHLPPQEVYNLLYGLPIVLVLRLISFYFFGLYKGLYRYASLPDLIAIVKAVLVSQITVVSVIMFLKQGAFPC